MENEPARIYRFGRFEFDLEREQLRRSGMLVKLPPQPAKLLGLLLQRAGEVVSREEIRRHLWPDGTWVDYEQGINHGVRRIRSVLGDDAASARFIQTVPRLGYRFFGGVETVAGNGSTARRDARWSWRPVAILALALLPVAFVARGLGTGREEPTAGARGWEPFERIRLEELTAQRNLWSAALSPDGVYLAYSLYESGGFALRVRSIRGDRDVRIVDPQEMPVREIAFSPDGSEIFFLRQASFGPGYSALFRVPTLGGEAREILFDVDSAVSFFPDGKRIVFVRGDPPNHRGHLVSARTDGSDERIVATWRSPDTLLPIRPATAPDGQRIAVAVRRGRVDAPVDLVVVGTEDGQREVLGARGWDSASGVDWLSDGAGLLWVAEEPDADDRRQIWRLDYPTGETHHVSSDLGSYQGVSLSRDDDRLVTLRRDRIASVWGFDSESESSQPWSEPFNEGSALLSVRRGPDGGVIFTAQRSGRTALWRSSAPDAPPEELLPSWAPSVRGFAVSPDGETVVFVAAGDDGRPHLWTVPSRGGEAVQRTHGAGEIVPGICNDGTLFFSRLGQGGLWSLASADASPRETFPLQPYSTAPVCSPDGTRVAFDTGVTTGDRSVRTLVVLPVEGGEATHRIPWPDGRLLAWRPDGRALTYMGEPKAAPEIWQVLLEDGRTSPIRATRNGELYSFDWSTDGQTLLAAHGRTRQYAVLISQLR